MPDASPLDPITVDAVAPAAIACMALMQDLVTTLIERDPALAPALEGRIGERLRRGFAATSGPHGATYAQAEALVRDTLAAAVAGVRPRLPHPMEQVEGGER